MSKSFKAAAAVYANLAVAMAVPEQAHAVEQLNVNIPAQVFVMPEIETQPLSNVVATKAGKFIIPTLITPEIDVMPRSFAPGPLEVLIARAVEKLPVEPVAPKPPTPEQIEQLRLSDIKELVSAVNINIHGVSPEVSQQGLGFLLSYLGIPGASAAWGAVIQESQGKTDAVSYGGGAYNGLFQWSATRYANVGASPWETLENQLQRGLWEMQNGYKIGTYDILVNNETSIDRAIRAMSYFEGEGVPGARDSYSRQIYYLLTQKFAEMDPGVFQPGGNPDIQLQLP